MLLTSSLQRRCGQYLHLSVGSNPILDSITKRSTLLRTGSIWLPVQYIFSKSNLFRQHTGDPNNIWRSRHNRHILFHLLLVAMSILIFMEQMSIPFDLNKGPFSSFPFWNIHNFVAFRCICQIELISRLLIFALLLRYKST